MEVRNREGYVESCVLVAEIDGSNHYFNVALPDIEIGMKTIRATYEKIDRKCSKVYIGGFTLVSRNTNLSKKGLVERVISSENIYRQLRSEEQVSLGR